MAELKRMSVAAVAALPVSLHGFTAVAELKRRLGSREFPPIKPARPADTERPLLFCNPGQNAAGWVFFDDLIIAIRYERRDWMDIERDDIVKMLAAMESDRFEIAGTKIRAVYGHSIALEKPPARGEPPDFQFHGTAEELIPEIMAKGLLRVGGQFAHLSSHLDWVLRFLANKPQWIVLRVLAGDAHR